MTRAMTLLEMAGALRQPAALSQAAVVIVDAQKEYDGGGLALPDLAPKIAEIAMLLARARARNTPVIHVRHLGQEGGLFEPQGEGSEFVAEAAPLPGETIVDKNLPNAFAGTGLQAQIRRLGRDRLIFSGFMTHMCISSSVRAAFDLGYDCTVVASATGTRPLPKVGNAEAALADETVQDAALAGLADRFAAIAEDVAALPD